VRRQDGWFEAAQATTEQGALITIHVSAQRIEAIGIDDHLRAFFQNHCQSCVQPTGFASARADGHDLFAFNQALQQVRQAVWLIFREGCQQRIRYSRQHLRGDGLARAKIDQARSRPAGSLSRKGSSTGQSGRSAEDQDSAKSAFVAVRMSGDAQLPDHGRIDLHRWLAVCESFGNKGVGDADAIDDDVTGGETAWSRTDSGFGPDHGDGRISLDCARSDLGRVRIDAAGQIDRDHFCPCLTPPAQLPGPGDHTFRQRPVCAVTGAENAIDDVHWAGIDGLAGGVI